jgi:hypothetical protein
MRKYLVQYSEDGTWIRFVIAAMDIYEANRWTESNVQQTGICVSRYSQ